VALLHGEFLDSAARRACPKVMTTILMGRRAASMIARISTSPEVSGRSRSLMTTSK